MFVYILIGVAVLLLATTCYFAGYSRSQGYELERARLETYALIEEKAALKAEVHAHETSLTMLMHEVTAA